MERAVALNAKDLAGIEQTLANVGDGSPFAELRRLFPKLFVTQCDASDVIESPFVSNACYDLHLVDSADHCVQITADPERATGIVVARRSAVS